jgi:integrase
MSVFQCKSGKHRGKWVCKFKNPDGKWITKYCVTKRVALRMELENLPEEEEDKPLSLGDLTVLYFRSNERNPRTVRTYVRCLCGYEKQGKHVQGAGEFLRNKPIEALTRRDLEILRQNLRDLHQAGNNTLNHYQAFFRAVMAWAVDQELIPRNPWNGFKRLPVRRPEITVSYDEVKRVYLAASPWLQWAIKTAYCLCLRPGPVELFSLKWTAFNWARGFVRIKQGKSGKFKTVMPPKEYLAEAQNRCEKDLADGIELVCTHDGKPVERYLYLNEWYKATKKAGVNLRFYNVRHLAASEMLAHGADLAAVAAQLGHASVAMTGQFYAHVMVGAQQRAAQSLPLI